MSAPPGVPTGPEKTRYVRSMFARIVGRYDLMNALMTLGRDRAWRRLAVREAAPPPGGRSLDVGAGTADLSLEIAARRAPGLVVALDLTPEMLAEGRRKATTWLPDAPVAFVVGDALALPFADSSFDAVVTGFTMRNVADLDGALRELRRALRPGGRAAILELTPLRAPLVAPLFRLYFHRVVPLIGRLVTGDAAAYAYLPASVDVFPSADELARRMRAAGFVSVRWRRMMLGTVALHLGTV